MWTKILKLIAKLVIWIVNHLPINDDTDDINSLHWSNGAKTMLLVCNFGGTATVDGVNSINLK